MWSCPLLWPGETAFVVAGGPSVARHDLRLLAGRCVVTVNSSCFTLPDADFLFTMDGRWLVHNMGLIDDRFGGRVVYDGKRLEKLGIAWPRVYLMERGGDVGIAADRSMVCGLRTSLHGAVNLAAHLVGRGGRIVVLGADGGPDRLGNVYHHAPHPWTTRRSRDPWRMMGEELKTTAEPLKRMGIRITNCSPGTRLNCWPKAERLEDCL